MDARTGAFVLWAVCGVLFACLGIYALFAKKPVRFWNVTEPVQVNNVKKYNQAVSKMWIIFAVIFIAAGSPLLLGEHSGWIVVPILGSMFWTIALAVVYTRIEKKYDVSYKKR